MNNRKVGIFRLEYPQPSETFIREQVAALRNFAAVYIGIRCVAEVAEEHASIDELGHSKRLGKIAMLTGNVSRLSKSLPEDIGLIHAHFGIDGVYALTLAKKLNIPLITTFHGYDATVSSRYLLSNGGVKNKVYLACRKKLAQDGDGFIAVSNFIKQAAVGAGFPSEKVVVHYIGVDIERFAPSKAPRDERYILNIARHTPKKGIETLIRAFAEIKDKFPDVNLYLAGEGELTPGLKLVASSLGCQRRIKFLGFQGPSDVVRLLQGCELFALTSETAPSGDCEGLGMVFNEASACGKPIVATHHGGIPEAVVHGETGLLVKEKAVAETAGALSSILGDKALALKMGQRGREFVCDNFDLRKQTKKLEEYYSEFL